MFFYTRYKVLKGDTLERIARKFGYTKTKPIANFPKNQLYFKNNRVLREGSFIFIPNHPKVLHKLIAKNQKHIQLTKQTLSDVKANRFDGANYKKDVEKGVDKYDAIISVILGSSLAKFALGGGAKGLGLASNASSTEALKWLGKEAVGWGQTVFSKTVEFDKINFEKPVNYHFKLSDNIDIVYPAQPKILLRHALGPFLSPTTYFSDIAGAIMDGDVDIYLYGGEIKDHKRKMVLLKNVEEKIKELQKIIDTAKAQLSSRAISL